MRVEIEGTPGRSIELVVGDITTQQADAIVNAANSGLRGGAGVDGAIHRAGGPEIMKESRKLGGCPTGSACLTTAGRLKATYVIHAVGPVWLGGDSGEPELLAGCYRKSLELADDKGLATIAFPSISTGAYRFPVTLAAPIALGTVTEHLRGETSIQEVRFVLFGNDIYDVYREALEDI